jgi:hypothetical protein
VRRRRGGGGLRSVGHAFDFVEEVSDIAVGVLVAVTEEFVDRIEDEHAVVFGEELVFELGAQAREVASAAAEIPDVEGFVVIAALGPGLADGSHALLEAPAMEFEVDEGDAAADGAAAPPGLAGGDAEGEVKEAPGFVALAGAAQDHFAALVKHAFDELRGGWLQGWP